MIYWFKRKYRQIKRVLDFLPIIWKGYDWDYNYAIELFKHQLKRTANEIESNGHLHDSKNVVSRIRTGVELIEKVYDEDYAFEYLDIIEQKYGKSKFEFIQIKELDQNGEPLYTVRDKYENKYTESEMLLIDEERRSLMHDSRAKQKRAHKILWDYIEHNIQYWWD